MYVCARKRWTEERKEKNRMVCTDADFAVLRLCPKIYWIIFGL